MNTKRIEKFLEEMQWLFQIQNFERKLTIAKNDEDENDEKKAAEITFDETYQFIRIKIFPCFFKETLKDQRKYLLHELCHTITLPEKLLLHNMIDGKLVTQEEIRKANEKATSQIDNILDGLLQGRMSYARKGYSNYLQIKKKKKRRKK